ncbi:MAG: dynamin family protein [Planctomycetota bacterium]
MSQTPAPSGSTPAKLIDEADARTIERQRQLLTALLDVCRAIDEQSPDTHQAAMLLKHLDDFFLLVVVGEVKSGKSAFINALLDQDVCAEGPTPVTDRIYILKHGAQRIERVLEEFVVECAFPLDILKAVNIVDTPGTNSIIRRHQEITEDFIPRSDLVLFVTSIDRPYSESEHQFLSFVSQKWRKKVLFLLTKTDTREPEDIEPVVQYIRENCIKHHHFDPTIFPISAKCHRQARAAAREPQAGLQQVEAYIRERLSEGDKLQLRLSSSADSAEAIIESLEKTLGERERILVRDFDVVNDLAKQVEQTGKDLKERYYRFITRIYDVLRDFERRGNNFFDDMIRLSRLNVLRDRNRFRSEFEKQVVGNLKEQVEETLTEAIDWLIKEELALYERALDFLMEKIDLARYEDRIVGTAERGFSYNREQVFRSIREGFRGQMDRFDVPGECHRVLNAANRGVLQQLGLQAGAVGASTVLVIALGALWMDITGILFGVGLFLTGFAILPRVRRRAQARFSERVDDLVRQFRTTISHEFDREIDNRVGDIRKVHEPYTTFYKAETHRLGEHREALKGLRVDLASVRGSLAEISAERAP